MTAGKKQTDEELLLDAELLTIQQVATWAKVSTKSIYRWIPKFLSQNDPQQGTSSPHGLAMGWDDSSIG